MNIVVLAVVILNCITNIQTKIDLYGTQLSRKTSYIFRGNAKDFALHFIEKVEDIEGTTSRRRDTHTLTTVLTKRLQLGKEVPSTTNRNNIRPSPSLASSQEWRGVEARSNKAASLPLPDVSSDDHSSRTVNTNTPDPCA